MREKFLGFLVENFVEMIIDREVENDDGCKEFGFVLYGIK